MTFLNPTKITEKQKAEIDRIEALPRSERRKLGKMLKVKIPGSNKPLELVKVSMSSKLVELQKGGTLIAYGKR